MSEAVELTIRELSAEIAQRQDLINSLRRVYPGATTGVAGVAVALVRPTAVTGGFTVKPTVRAVPQPRDPTLKVKARAVRAVKGVGKGGTPGTWLYDSAAAVARVKEAFTTKEVAEALGVTWKRASNWLTQAKLKGWVSRVSPGEYVRTKLFPVVEKKTERRDASPTLKKADQSLVTSSPTIEDAEPVVGGAGAELRVRIAECCRVRDGFRAKGQEHLAEVEQERIDRMDEQLEALG